MKSFDFLNEKDMVSFFQRTFAQNKAEKFQLLEFEGHLFGQNPYLPGILV